MESLSVTLILPLSTAMVNGDSWQDEWYARAICSIFRISDHRSYVIVLLILLIIIFIVKNLYLLFEYYCQDTFIARARFDTQKKLMKAYIYKPYSFYLTANTGEIVRIVTSDTVDMFSLLSATLQFYTEIIVSIVLVATIIAISPGIASRIILILMVELLVITRIIKPKLKKLGTIQREEGAVANKWLLQSINGIKSIKVANSETFFENNYSRHADKVVETMRINQTLSNLPRLIIESVTVAGVLSIILVMVLNGSNMTSIFPQLSAFIVATVRLLPSVNRISTSVNGITFSEGGLDNIIRVLNNDDIAENIKKDTVRMAGGLSTGENWQTTDSTGQIIEHNNRKIKTKDGNISEIIRFSEELYFKDITFSYPGAKNKIFDKASFKIKSGDSVGIIGSSGAGKTTAVDIILGLLQPDSGEILADGKNINSEMTSWLSHVAYIPQSIYLLDDTICANVAFGKYENEVDEEAVWTALEEAQMDSFVRELPDQLNTSVGEQGIRLSGGQRQRIGIARALYNNPDIIFLDEATSALDNDTEAAIMEAIDSLKRKKTLVIIAHRLSTTKNCDVIYRVEDGKVNRESK